MSLSATSLQRSAMATTGESHKNIKKNEQTYRDGVPKKQPNIETNDTSVPLWTPIPISFDIFQPGLMLVAWNDRMLDRDMYILWQFFESTIILIANGLHYAIGQR